MATAIYTDGRRLHASAMRQPRMGRRASIEKYQNVIIDRIRSKLETNRKSWEEDIKKAASPVTRRRLSSSLGEDEADSGAVRVGKRSGPKVLSRHRSLREGGVTQWTIKLNVNDKRPDEALRVRLEKDAIHLETSLRRGEIQEVIRLEDAGSVLPETLQIKPTGLDTLTIRLCTKL